MHLAAPRPGETAVVFGAGPIGLLTIAMLKLSGIRRVWAVEPVDARRELALALGRGCGHGSCGGRSGRVKFSETSGRGVDMAIDCAARSRHHQPMLVRGAQRRPRNHDRNSGAGTISSLAFHIMRRKELAFFSVRRSNHDSETALRLLESEPKRFAPVLDAPKATDADPSGVRICESYEDGVGKMTIRF